MAFSLVVVFDGEEKAGTNDAGVNGLHGRSARALVDDGGRPGMMSLRMTTTTGKIAPRIWGPKLRADPDCGGPSAGPYVRLFFAMLFE
jgi:hypothetical protein